jgi:hypothetical protein
MDLTQLVARYGDPSKSPLPRPVEVAPKSAKDEAIDIAVRVGGVTEDEVRPIADKLEPALQDAPLIRWVELLLHEIQLAILVPRRAQKDAERRRRTGQRIVRQTLEAAKAAEHEALPPMRRRQRSSP